jgi:hypothetical protein
MNDGKSLPASLKNRGIVVSAKQRLAKQRAIPVSKTSLDKMAAVRILIFCS